MTENPDNASASALLDRIQQMVDERGVDIRQNLNGNALRLEFADGQRVLINVNLQTQNVWLAARSGGIEFIHRNGSWRAHDHSELFAKLREIIDQTIASNPINGRARSPQIAEPPPPPVIYYITKETHGLRNTLIVLLAAGLGFFAAQRLSRSHEADSLGPTTRPHLSSLNRVALNKMDMTQQCEAGFPANGNVTVFPENPLHTDGPNDPEITLKNDHAHPLLLFLTTPRSTIPYLSVLIHARQSTTLHLPAGQYDMMFGVGNTWCNARSGFSDGHILKLDSSLTVQMEKPLQIAMQSSGAGMEDFQLFIKAISPEASLPPPTFTGDGSMEVQRQANGHFYLPGTIENVPITFMVDTGASVTSISRDIAQQAGIRNCKAVQFQTANGTATGCVAFVPRMTLGNFVLENITIAVMPNMETNLLGANVLRNFQVSQNDSSMLIGRR